MSETAKKDLERITEKLDQIPTEIAMQAVNQYTARVEGYAEGFAAGVAHASKEG
jgi:predicted transcriptional regulator